RRAICRHGAGPLRADAGGALRRAASGGLPSARGHRAGAARGTGSLRPADPCHLCRPVPGLHRRDGGERVLATRPCARAALADRRARGRAPARAGGRAARRWGGGVSSLAVAPAALPAAESSARRRRRRRIGILLLLLPGAGFIALAMTLPLLGLA